MNNSPEVGTTHTLGSAVGLLRRDKRLIEYKSINYKVVHNANARILIEVDDENNLTFLYPEQMMNYSITKCAELLYGALSKFRGEYGTRTSLTIRNIQDLDTDGGIVYESDAFKRDHGITLHENSPSESKILKQALDLIYKLLPKMKEIIPKYRIRTKTTKDLTLYYIVDVSPHTKEIFIDQYLLSGEVPLSVVGYLIYVNIGVIRKWSKVRDKANEESLNTYVRSWSTYRSDLKYIEEMGWRLQYGQRRYGFWNDSE